MSEEKKYVDADALIKRLKMICNPGYNSNYSAGQLDNQVNQLIQQAMTNAFSSFMTNLENAIRESSQPYSQCMLCTRKPHDHDPFDTNR